MKIFRKLKEYKTEAIQVDLTIDGLPSARDIPIATGVEARRGRALVVLSGGSLRRLVRSESLKGAGR